MRYLVSYDISDPKDRVAVTSKLEGKDMGAKPVLESQWIIDKDNTTAEDICNELCNVTSRKKVLILVNTWDCSKAVLLRAIMRKRRHRAGFVSSF